MPSIQDCTTWQCINSFALWLSAIGTLTVSVIALWLSIKDRYVRMSASFHKSYIARDAPSLENMYVYLLSFTNIGPRPITVVSYEWAMPKGTGKYNRAMIFPQLNPEVSYLCTKLPVELTDGQSGQILHVENFFDDLEDKEKFLFPKSKWGAWYRIMYFRIYIITSLGKRLPVRISKELRKELWSKYKQWSA